MKLTLKDLGMLPEKYSADRAIRENGWGGHTRMAYNKAISVMENLDLGPALIKLGYVKKTELVLDKKKTVSFLCSWWRDYKNKGGSGSYEDVATALADKTQELLKEKK